MRSQSLMELDKELGELAKKETALRVAQKLREAREDKQVGRSRAFYEGLITQLLEEREQAVCLAQVYRAELNHLEISDEDMGRLQKTMGRALEILRTYQLIRNDSQQMEALEQILSLMNADTLRTMQLLGIDCRSAIGEPLTEMCLSALSTAILKPHAVRFPAPEKQMKALNIPERFKKDEN